MAQIGRHLRHGWAATMNVPSGLEATEAAPQDVAISLLQLILNDEWHGSEAASAGTTWTEEAIGFAGLEGPCGVVE
jgi:hypothetical protein